MKRSLHSIILPALLAATLLLAVRFLLFMHVRIPAEGGVGPYKGGTHLAVSLTAYGLRLPGEAFWGYCRLGYARPQKGDGVVCSMAANQGMTLGICRALPADTIWIDSVRRRILPAHTSPDAQPIVIPSSLKPMHVTPANARLYAYLLRTYEESRAKVNQQGELVINGKPLHSVRFSTDYYWLETLPDSFILVPHKALVGKAYPIFSRTGTAAHSPRT